TLRHALALGLNLIDTAPDYGKGLSEELVGRVLTGLDRDSFVIATKVSHRNARSDKVRTSMEESLRRLRLDHVDLLQYHWPHPQIPLAETLGAMTELKAAGLVRAIGVCNWMEPEWEEIAEGAASIDCLQPCHSLLWRSIEPWVLPFCIENKIAVLPYSPLCQGALAGRFPGVGELPTLKGDPRTFNQRLTAEEITRTQPVLEILKETAARYGKTPAQTALRWLLDQEGITAPIVGASSPAQVDENLGALGWSLEKEDWHRFSLLSWPLSAGLAPHDTLFGFHPRRKHRS
ncbi:MAG: aldo/keto reductase, partial [Planctomycetes bacterium]|nr:aldo/keto reductase [Planctomycetota bacterium]